ncbi:hypothetical protein, partial [Achromobacter xylosoxidans]|uniref:hypothetical protein n=1 Tax=Alcaligenes xylosoxydans xylosoxydans TaxID=85698 RepID=UPI001E4085FF
IGAAPQPDVGGKRHRRVRQGPASLLSKTNMANGWSAENVISSTNAAVQGSQSPPNALRLFPARRKPSSYSFEPALGVAILAPFS